MAFASDRWVVAHLCGILGLALLAPALLGLRALLARRERASAPHLGARHRVGLRRLAALYFGAEICGIRTIADAALRDGDLGLLADIEVLRMQPWAVTVFVAGLVLLAVSGVLVAVALWRPGTRRGGPGCRWRSAWCSCSPSSSVGRSCGSRTGSSSPRDACSAPRRNPAPHAADCPPRTTEA